MGRLSAAQAPHSPGPDKDSGRGPALRVDLLARGAASCSLTWGWREAVPGLWPGQQKLGLFPLQWNSFCSFKGHFPEQGNLRVEFKLLKESHTNSQTNLPFLQ